MSADRLPNDLPGGWEHHGTFKAVPLNKDQVWRKAGPVDALKIIRVMFPGHPEHDGAAQGISVRPTVIATGGRVTWSRKTWFKLGNEAQVHEFLRANGYTLAHV